MRDLRRLNEVYFSARGIETKDGVKPGICIMGTIGTKQRREKVILEEDIPMDRVEYLISRWKEKVGVRWDVILYNKNGAWTHNDCPSCGCDNDRRFQDYLDGKYKPLDGTWTPYMSDFGGSGWITISCQKCGQLYNIDISS